MSRSLSRHSQRLPLVLNTTFQEQKPLITEPRSSKFLIRKELYSGIKSNNPHRIISRSHSRTKQQSTQIDQSAQVEANLNFKRKGYDDHKTATKIRKKQIQDLKKELKELNEIQVLLKNNILYSKKSLDEIVQFLEDTKVQSEYTILKKDVYENILDRTKNSILFQKKKLFDMETEIDKLKKKCASFQNQRDSKKNMEKQCRKMLNSVQKIVSKQKVGRQARLASLHDSIKKKQDSLKKRQERERQIYLLAEQTANEKTYEEKEWNRLYHTHKFLHAILKNKIAGEMASNEQIQKSFQRIKLSTGITQSQEFVRKYLTHQQTYGSLLHQISQKEPLLEKMQEKKQKLANELKEIEEEESQHLQFNYKQQNDQNSEYFVKQREYQKLSGKCLTYQKLRESFYQWAIKFLKKHDKLINEENKNRLNYYDIYPREQLAVLYKKIQFLINNVLIETSKNTEDVNAKLLQSHESDTMDSDSFLKNNRVRTQENKSKLDARDCEDQESEYLNEMQFVHQNRKNVIREQRVKKFRVKTKAH